MKPAPESAPTCASQDALAWFHRTYAIDADQLTDAAERAEALEKRQTED